MKPDFTKIPYAAPRPAAPAEAGSVWMTPEGIPVKGVYSAADLERRASPERCEAQCDHRQ